MIRWLLCLSLCGSAAATDEPQFRWTRPIDAPPRTAEELVVVTLDRDIHQHTRDGWPDLRILDERDRPQPYLLRQKTTDRTETVRHYWTAQKATLMPTDQGLEIRVDLNDKDPQPNGVRLITPLQNFEQHVQVFGADDPPLAEGVVFDYAQYMDVRNVDIPFSSGKQRAFRLLVGGLTAQQESPLVELTRRLGKGVAADESERLVVNRRPFRIDRLEFWREETRRTESATAFEPVVNFSVREDEKERQTVVEITTGREPLVGLRLLTDSRNFSRTATAAASVESATSAPWQTVGSGTIARFDFRDLHHDEQRVRFPERRAEKYRVTIDNRDNAPLTIAGCEGEHLLYEAVFFAAPGGNYRLTYGADVDQRPEYDTAAITAALARGYAPVSAALGPSQPTGAQPAAFDWRRLINHPLVLGAVVLVLVVLLAGGLYRAARQVDQQHPPEP